MMGGCIARVPCETCVELAGVSERDGEYVTIAGIEPRTRSSSLGTPHHLDLSTDAFATIFSIRCHDSEHINLREGRALIHYLKWVLRSRDRHGHRIVLLVDSRVVVGGFSKGRSGSPSLNALIRQAAVLCMAGGLVLHQIYVPTEFNLADYPSRGTLIPRRPPRAAREPRCLGCGATASSHPMCAPKRLRGGLLRCPRGFRWVDGDWIDDADDGCGRLISSRRQRAMLRGCFNAWAIAAFL